MVFTRKDGIFMGELLVSGRVIIIDIDIDIIIKQVLRQIEASDLRRSDRYIPQE